VTARLRRSEFTPGSLLKVILRQALVVAALAAAAAVGIRSVRAQSSRSLADGVYTEQQATRGQALFKDQCASCHGDTLDGKSGPPLAGDEFIANWKGSDAGSLFYVIKQNMPKGNSAGSLSGQQSADLLAFILSSNKFPAGQTELESDQAPLTQLKIEAAKRP
jgi:S-disulfanyl-L-cysteine oxidoreductase SoxD